MNVDNENQHSSRAAHYQSPPLIPLKLYNICWAQGRACCVVSTGCWIRSGVANFTRFIHHFPNIGLQITPGWTVNTFLAPPPPLLTSSWPGHVVNVSQFCLRTTILVPSRVCSPHCHQNPASGCWPLPPLLPLIHQWHLHDKLAGALQTKLDSLKIPPTCKTSYINIRDKTEKC